MSSPTTRFEQSYFHGTRADLTPGDRISTGFASNFSSDQVLSFVYFSATLDAAIWGAELALGDGAERIYVVEPTGPLQNDPNVTDKKFPGNPTLSYRSRDALLVIGEVIGWHGHPPDRLQQMKDGIAALKAAAADRIID